jgi:DNA-binding NarL/FixJ family response regulator
VVLLDMIMPVMSGEEVFREIRNIRPGTKVLLTSGYDERDALAHFREGEPAGFIQKPFRMAELVAAIRSTLEA